MDGAETTARPDKKHLSLEIWGDLYQRFYGKLIGNYQENRPS